MKNLVALFVWLGFLTAAHASEVDLLERAVNCELHDDELVSLVETLKHRLPEFKKPAVQYGAPSVDVYHLTNPIRAHGYTSNQVVFSPGRILLAVPAKSLSQAVRALHLEEDSFLPASRTVRPTVSIVAYQLSHQALAGRLLVGCQYVNQAASHWLQE